jgi:hypothetical protein
VEGAERVLLTEDQRTAVNMAARLVTAVDRADRLGWRTITIDRLLRIAEGDASAMPPDPATAPPSARGSRPRHRLAQEDRCAVATSSSTPPS